LGVGASPATPSSTSIEGHVLAFRLGACPVFRADVDPFPEEVVTRLTGNWDVQEPGVTLDQRSDELVQRRPRGHPFIEVDLVNDRLWQVRQRNRLTPRLTMWALLAEAGVHVRLQELEYLHDEPG
jgi:hypothetical protein